MRGFLKAETQATIQLRFTDGTESSVSFEVKNW